MKYEVIKTRKDRKQSFVKKYWKKKLKSDRKNIYSKERERYYNRNGQGTLTIDEIRNKEGNVIKMLMERKKDIR